MRKTGPAREQRFHLEKFQVDHAFYGEISLLVTIKSFDLQAIRKRYLASRKNKNGRAGSINRRKVGMGGLAHLRIREGKVIHSEILCRMKEPRGIDVSAGRLAVAAENELYVLEQGRIFSLANDWFSYIHSTIFSPYHSQHILVASSGLDCVFEANYRTGKISREWFAWENGFNVGWDPEQNVSVFLTRQQEQAEKYLLDHRPHRLITDPVRQSLPTAMRAAFINSVWYGRSEGVFLATLFHEGAVYQVHFSDGKAELVLDGLSNPHGGRTYRDGYLATSTGSGEVVIREGGQKRIFDFRQLPGKPDSLGDMEWVQNSVAVNGYLLSIDSNRNCFVIFDPDRQLCALVPFDDNWAIQDLVPCVLNSEQRQLLAKLSVN